MAACRDAITKKHCYETMESSISVANSKELGSY